MTYLNLLNVKTLGFFVRDVQARSRLMKARGKEYLGRETRTTLQIGNKLAIAVPSDKSIKAACTYRTSLRF